MKSSSKFFSNLGFVLTVAGAAIGLGNAWKFPTMTGTNGGSAFLLLFVGISLSLGLVMFMAEIYVGKSTRLDLANAYCELGGKRRYKLGGIFMLGGVFVLSFYLVILSWVLAYVFLSFNIEPDIAKAGAKFGSLVKEPSLLAASCLAFCMMLTLYVVSKGIKSGIERFNVYATPLLCLLLIAMLIYAAMQDGFLLALRFLFQPDFSKVTLEVALDALGLSMFTLCLGVGCISAYAVALPEKHNVLKSTVILVFIDIGTSLVMGLIIFTFIFEFNQDPAQQGVGLVFVSLVTLFAKMGSVGTVLAVTFFFALFLAGITSAVSMIEPVTLFLEKEFKLSRAKALSMLGALMAPLSILSMLSLHKGSSINLFGKSFFDCLDFLSSNIMLPSGVFFCAVFLGFVADKSRLEAFFRPYFGAGFAAFYFFLRFVAPLFIAIVAVNNFYPLAKLF